MVTFFFATVLIQPLQLTLLAVDVFALTMIVGQVGGILISILLTGKTIFKLNIHGVVIGQFLMYGGLFILALSVLTSNIYLLILSSCIGGATIPLANMHSQTIWQSVVPPELQGRVMSVRMVIAWVFIPFSMLLAGFLADIIKIDLIFILGGAIGLLFLAYVWFFTGLPNVEEQLGLKEERTESGEYVLSR